MWQRIKDVLREVRIWHLQHCLAALNEDRAPFAAAEHLRTKLRREICARSPQQWLRITGR